MSVIPNFYVCLKKWDLRPYRVKIATICGRAGRYVYVGCCSHLLMVEFCSYLWLSFVLEDRMWHVWLSLWYVCKLCLGIGCKLFITLVLVVGYALALSFVVGYDVAGQAVLWLLSSIEPSSNVIIIPSAAPCSLVWFSYACCMSLSYQLFV